MIKPQYKSFTMVEVLVSLAILLIGIGGFLLLMSAASARMERSLSFRRNHHQLANAVEFYLLYPPETVIEPRFFPYEGVSINCIYSEPNLPENMESEIGLKKLVLMTVTLSDSTGNEIAGISLDRIIRAEND